MNGIETNLVLKDPKAYFVRLKFMFSYISHELKRNIDYYKLKITRTGYKNKRVAS